MTCAACGHPAESHWAPHEPPHPTACRDCLSRGLYICRMTPFGNFTQHLCTATQEFIRDGA